MKKSKKSTKPKKPRKGWPMGFASAGPRSRSLETEAAVGPVTSVSSTTIGVEERWMTAKPRYDL